MGHNHNHDDDHEHYYDDSYLHSNQHVFLGHYIDMLNACGQGLYYLTFEETSDVEKLKECLNGVQAIKDANFLAGNLMKKIDLETYEKINSFDELILPVAKKLGEQLEENRFQAMTTLAKELYPFFQNWVLDVHNALEKHLPKSE